MSVPPGTEMFQFPGFASCTYGFSAEYPSLGGLPHSDIHGSTPARGSPWLFAACHVLHRLLVPRHPPNALLILDTPAPTRRSEPPCTETILRCGLRRVRMILRYRHFAHHRIVSNRVSPRLLAQPWRHPIRSIVHTAPLNPRRRPLGLPSHSGGITRSDIRSRDGPAPVTGFSRQAPDRRPTPDDWHLATDMAHASRDAPEPDSH